MFKVNNKSSRTTDVVVVQLFSRMSIADFKHVF